MERINSIDQDLIFPLREACKGLGQLVPRHGEKHHFTSLCFFFWDSGCATAKLVHNLSQAFWSAVVANFYVEPGLKHALCKRLRQGSCSYSSDLHVVSFLIV